MATAIKIFRISQKDLASASAYGIIRDWRSLMDLATKVGTAAEKACIPTPIEVYEAEILTDRQIGPSERVDKGLCGRASIIIKPATQPVVRWIKQFSRSDDPKAKQMIDLRKQGWSYLSHKHYYGGWELYVCMYSQSYARHVAHANAVIQIFQAAKISCYSKDWLD